MKKQINLALSYTVAATMLINSAFSQGDNLSFTDASKLSENAKTAGKEISSNVRANQSFAKKFSSAKNIAWRETGKEFIATFKMDDRLAVAWFTKSGQLYCTNYYGTAKHLPEAHTAVVQQNYPEYAVTGTLEIQKNNITAYVVTIQSLTNQKKVKVINDEIEEMESLKLAR